MLLYLPSATKFPALTGKDYPAGWQDVGPNDLAFQMLSQGVATTAPVSGAGNQAASKVNNYVAVPGYEFDALTSTAGWSVSTTGAGSAVTPTIMQDGKAGLQFTVAPGAGNQALITYSGADAGILYDQSTTLGLWVEVFDPGRAPGVTVLVSTETGQVFTNYVTLSFGKSGGDVFGGGLYFIPVCISDAGNGAGTGATGGVAFGAGKISSIRIRVINTYKNQGATVKIRSLRVNCRGESKMAIVFDDNYRAAWTEAARIMMASGYAATFAINPNLVGSAGRMTWADVIDAANAGHDMCSHTPSHVAFNSFNTTAIAASQAVAGAGNLTLNGSVGAAAFDQPRHVVFKTTGGDQGVKATVTGWLKGVQVIEDLYLWTSFTVPTTNMFDKVDQIAIDQAMAGNVSVGQSCSESEMSAAITGPTQTMLSNGVPPDAVKLMFVYPQGEFNATSTRLLKQLGYRCARIVGGRRQCPQAGDFRPFELPGYGGASADSATLDAYRDIAIREGDTTIVYGHDYTNGVPGANQININDWKTFWTNTMAAVSAGKIKIVKMATLPVA